MLKLNSKLVGVVAACTMVAAMVGAGPEKKKIKIGEAAPEFTLMDVNGKEHKLSEYSADGQTVVLEWFNPSCPYVKKHYTAETGTTTKLEKKFSEEKVTWLRINSGSDKSGTSGKVKNIAAAKEFGIKSPILLDADGTVGKLYNARTTPTIVVISAEGKVAYYGALDNNKRMGIGDVNYANDAVAAVLAGETVAVTKTKSYGCGVKYAK